MDFVSAIKSAYKKMFTFNGRASLSEFWWFYLYYVLVVLCSVIVFIALSIVLNDYVSRQSSELIVGITFVAMLILSIFVLFFPGLSLIVRRLHDTNKSGWLILLYLIPFAGLILFVFYLWPGDRWANPHGDDPRLKAKSPLPQNLTPPPNP